MFSKIVRRTHMYLALFLAPWVLMYTLSTLAMNHRELFRRIYGGTPVSWVKERELVYTGTFAPEATPEQIGEQILSSLGMEGAFATNRPAAGRPLLVTRLEPVTPRRLTYTPSDRKLVIERQAFRTGVFLERLHRMRGYQYPFVLNDVWAVSVDLFIVGMIFWALSGLWMWWELKVTRRLGALALLGGAALFALFVFTI
ncbi:MAG: hypothetical protein HYZ57_18280 [Acidobacteria bacterium]|nr:hypothetical protein [Acidobacteriota bacterium]MBI3281776.1 hypothetical protein [Acidobacteriota bacterium]